MFSSNSGVLEEQKPESFSQGLIWHVASHSIGNEINVSVLFQVFMWKKKKAQYSQRKFLYILLQFIIPSQSQRVERTPECSCYKAFAAW